MLRKYKLEYYYYLKRRNLKKSSKLLSLQNTNQDLNIIRNTIAIMSQISKVIFSCPSINCNPKSCSRSCNYCL